MPLTIYLSQNTTIIAKFGTLHNNIFILNFIQFTPLPSPWTMIGFRCQRTVANLLYLNGFRIVQGKRGKSFGQETISCRFKLEVILILKSIGALLMTAVLWLTAMQGWHYNGLTSCTCILVAFKLLKVISIKTWVPYRNYLGWCVSAI